MIAALARFLPERLRLLVERGGQPLRFLIAGGANTVFGFTIYPLLRFALPQVHYMASLGIAQALSLCFAYCSYKLLVFRSGGNVLREVGTFSSYYLFTIALNWMVLPVMVRMLHLAPAVAQTGFGLLLMVGSYFWHSRVTFKTLKTPS